MRSKFKPFVKSSRQIHSFIIPVIHDNHSSFPISPKVLPFSVPKQSYLHHQINNDSLVNPLHQNPDANDYIENEAIKIQSLLKRNANKPIESIQQSLNRRNVALSEDLVLNVLKRHRYDWKLALTFFDWICKAEEPNGFSLNNRIYNEMLEILGRMRCFGKISQVLDEMCKRGNLIDEETYNIVVHRYAAAHKVKEAIEFFYKREEYGLECNLPAFQTLLLSLCRYKHVEDAEVLFRNKRSEFPDDIKSWNIILNGWSVLGSLRDVKRFWKDIVTSKCKLDKFTYGILINALSKSGKISTALKLYRAMWKEGLSPDVAICNTVIEGLCFKKRIPEAFEVFHEMEYKGCSPNAGTYNSIIKHLCKIRRMKEVDVFLNEMEARGGDCLPNALTYGALLKVAKKPEEVDKIVERIEKTGLKLNADTYNMIIRLFMDWGDEKRAKDIWDEMEKNGLGPDRRSYTIMIHGLHDKGQVEDALRYFTEMISKGMVPEARTKLLVDTMNLGLDKSQGIGEVGLKNSNSSTRLSDKQGPEQ